MSSPASPANVTSNLSPRVHIALSPWMRLGTILRFRETWWRGHHATFHPTWWPVSTSDSSTATDVDARYLRKGGHSTSGLFDAIARDKLSSLPRSERAEEWLVSAYLPCVTHLVKNTYHQWVEWDYEEQEIEIRQVSSAKDKSMRFIAHLVITCLPCRCHEQSQPPCSHRA